MTPELLDRQPPSDVEAEKSYVGAAIVSRDILEQYPVDPGDFHTEALGRLCDHLHNYPVDGPITAEGLVAWLAPSDLEAVGGKAGIAEAVEACGHVAHAGLFASRIRNAAAKRRIITRLCDGLRHAYNGEDDAPALLNEIRLGLDTLDVADKHGFGWLRTDELMGSTFDPTFIVNGLLVRHQSCVLFGPGKSLKTSLAVDLAVSVGAARKFLGQFWVPEKLKVGVMSGESGMATLQRTVRRVAAAKGLDPNNIAQQILWSEDLPRLTDATHLSRMAKTVRINSIDLLVLDPFYKTIPQANTASLNEMGELLDGVDRLCRDTGVSVVIVHHTVKRPGANHRKEYAPPELGDVHGAAIVEWSRQQIQVARRSPYEHGSGHHELYLQAGGSAGHGGRWYLDVDEGRFDPESMSLEKWKVTIRSPDDAREYEHEQRTEARQDAEHRTQAAREERRQAIVEADSEAIIRALARLGRDTMRGIREQAGLGNGQKFNRPWAALLSNEEIVEDGEIKRPNGQSYPAYRLAETD